MHQPGDRLERAVLLPGVVHVSGLKAGQRHVQRNAVQRPPQRRAAVRHHRHAVAGLDERPLLHVRLDGGGHRRAESGSNACILQPESARVLRRKRHPVLVGKIGHGNRCSPRRPVRRRNDHRERHRTHLDEGQPVLVRRRQEEHDEVEVASHQPVHQCGGQPFLRVHLQVGEPGVHLGQQARQHHRDHGGQQAQPQRPSGEAAELRQLLAGPAGAIDQYFRPHQQPLAGRRKAHAPPVAVDQPQPELALKSLHGVRDRRLHEVQAVRGPGEAALLDDRHKYP